jgi:hypothetical protein
VVTADATDRVSGGCQVRQLEIPNCCALPTACLAAPPSPQYGLSVDCYLNSPGSTPLDGGVCRPDGSCAIEPIEPIAMCCQRYASCSQGSATSTGELASFHNDCTLQSGTTVPGEICGAEGICVQP